MATGANTSLRDFNGRSALDRAAQNGDVDAIKSGAVACEAGSDDAENKRKWLDRDAYFDQAEAIGVLVKAGGDTEVQDDSGGTPLGREAGQ